jgi:AraC family transcriptional regulator, transcriptional activator of pobA
MAKKPIPIYSINQFQRAQPENVLYEVEPFDKNRSFTVEYPHRHDNFYELLFITEGSGSYTIDLQTYPIQANTVFFVSPGQVHTIDFSEDIKGYIFLFTSAFYRFDKDGKSKQNDYPFFHQLSGHTPPIHIESSEEMLRLFEMACAEHRNPQENTDTIIRSVLEIMLAKCKRLFRSSSTEHLSKGRLLIARFQQLIEEHVGLNWGVKEFAIALSVTPAHLNESIKDHTGITASGHIKEQIILESKRLLTHTELTVSEISERLYFEDSSYFSKYFKKSTKKSPSEYRAAQRKQ